MDYTLAGLRQRIVDDKLDDDEFDPDIVDNFINDAQRDIFNQFELPFQEKIFEGSIPIGATMVELPQDVALIQSQYLAGAPNFANRKMKFTDFFQKNQDIINEKPSTPDTWTQYAGNILLSAPTDKEYKLTVFYVRKPKDLLQNQDIPEIPSEFSELLILGAFMRIQKRNEDFDLAQNTEAEYDKQLMQLVNRYGLRSTGPIKLPNQQIRG